MDLNTSTIPAVIGAAFGGGFYAGRINVDGVAFALIVSPRAFGEFKGRWSVNDGSVPGAQHYSDGMANTEAMAGAGSELAALVLRLKIGNLADWYIPSRDELEVVYRHFKPTGYENYADGMDGVNAHSVPPGVAYGDFVPSLTEIEGFQDGGTNALDDDWYWSSTQYAPYPSYAWGQYFGNGNQLNDSTSCAGRARAVRRLKI
ncbi:DUF1566 domain-containing protein [Janthinobacterium sp.]|uniref:Lcl domain-containing protein n=1 Tax=Janthinobacterium sp. TaxID=1871054 RepID=UPI00293D9079|nr:DUF1566 domain-containing protein [Janthinobacterium sp.]